LSNWLAGRSIGNMGWSYSADSPKRDTSIPVEEEMRRLHGEPVQRPRWRDRVLRWFGRRG
jgi:hypothetical protein